MGCFQSICVFLFEYWSILKGDIPKECKTECIARGAEVIQVPILNPIIPIGIDKVPTGKCAVRLFLSLGHPVLHSEYSEIQLCCNQFEQSLPLQLIIWKQWS